MIVHNFTCELCELSTSSDGDVFWKLQQLFKTCSVLLIYLMFSKCQVQIHCKTIYI